jgi:hypothetical protein
VDVFQVGDQLCFGFEAAHEVRLVGVLGQDDLDCHFAFHHGLVSAVDYTECALTDVVLDGVAFDGLTGESVHELCPAYFRQRIGAA